MNEYIQYALHRLHYYLPPFLPTDIFADKAKTGYVNPTIYIPIEDLGDGWKAMGQVGQEVYGAALFLNLCIHHVVKLDEDTYVVSSLPFIQNGNKQEQIQILGATSQEGILWIKTNSNSIQVEINRKKQPNKEYHQIKADDTLKFIRK